MGDYSSKFEVRNAHAAFDRARAGLGLNATTFVLNRDWKAQSQIVSRLQEMGQTQLVNLTQKYTEAAMSLVFYAGDGIVTKVMCEADYDKSSPIYHLPAITSEKIETEEDNSFVINTYPWIPGGYLSRDSIEEMRVKIQAVGMDFTTNDDSPRNIHTMPDEHHTLVGIDASMYTTAHNGRSRSPELEQAWRQYIETVFPIYKTKKIPKQTPDTDFQFRSIHDRESGILGFDSVRFLEEGKDPIVRATNKLTTETQSIWDRLFSWGKKDTEPDANEPI